MIKGNERRIVVVENLSDPYFERAVFYVRVGASAGHGTTLSTRAQELWDALREEETPSATSTDKNTALPPPREKKHRFFGRKGRRRKNEILP